MNSKNRQSALSKTRWVIAAIVVVSVAGIAAWAQLGSNRESGSLRIEVVAAYPHDRNAFTQGLVVHDGRIYEGTGQYGRSSVRRIGIENGLVEKMTPLNGIYFGEGITIFDDRLYQLTWQKQIGFVYDIESFDVVDTFRYTGEGWGLTHDGEHLIVSDGSATLQYWNPETFDVVKRLDVSAGGSAVLRLNELEYIDGEIWANVWYDDRIARISPESGEVLGWVDLSGLYPRAQRSSEDVLNGIAFDAESRRLFVTGKNWPQLFEIRIAR